jgi:hypothetical protein
VTTLVRWRNATSSQGHPLSFYCSAPPGPLDVLDFGVVSAAQLSATDTRFHYTVRLVPGS